VADYVDQDTTALLRQDFDLPRGGLTEAELLDWLTARVAEMLRNRLPYLMSLCYTLDLEEEDVTRALTPSPPAAPPARALALLLYERQCARARSKRDYPARPLTDPDAW
jgi:hypothetical protein